MDAAVKPSCSPSLGSCQSHSLFDRTICLFPEPQVPSLPIACGYFDRSPPRLRSAPYPPYTDLGGGYCSSKVPRPLHCLCGLQDLLVMKRNFSCFPSALLHPCFQLPYCPANIQASIHPSQMVANYESPGHGNACKDIGSTPKSTSEGSILSRRTLIVNVLKCEHGSSERSSVSLVRYSEWHLRTSTGDRTRPKTLFKLWQVRHTLFLPNQTRDRSLFRPPRIDSSNFPYMSPLVCS